MGLEAVFTLGLAAARFQSRETIFLIFSLMAGLIGIFVALGTVAMFEQVTQVTFLLLGWSQSLVDIRAYGVQTVPVPDAKFRFRPCLCVISSFCVITASSALSLKTAAASRAASGRSSRQCCA